MLAEHLASTKEALQTAILELKQKKNAVILAHYYQDNDIQDVADCLGDSLALAQEANRTDAEIIVFAGVHFMAETAKILNPNRKVLLPDINAGCSLADSCPAADFRAFKAQYPNYFVVSYINCSAEVKSLSDVICTSSNAVKIVNAIDHDKKIIFAPDRNLGRYVQEQTGREMVIWDGACTVHEVFSMDKLVDLARKYPDAEIIAHPECEEHIIEVAAFVGSTSALLAHVKSSPKRRFIVATEAGILHQMAKDVPNKELIPAPSVEDNTCSCSECAFMKMNTLEKLYICLKNETPEIHLSDELMKAAHLPIQRMLSMSV